MTSATKYKIELAKYLNAQPDQISLYWKGRVGLYALLKAMGIGEGDEVIIPAFTCVVVPNAILYLGAKPVYVDVSGETLNTTLDRIESKVTERTRCIVIQNTFGLSSQVEEIVKFSKAKNILTIEDCTHGFGGFYKNSPNGSYSDAAFYSTQWNKPFSTGIGGFSLLNNSHYQDSLDAVNNELSRPKGKDKYILATLIQAKKLLLNDTTYWSAIKLYRSLSKSGIVVGSSKGEELTHAKMPNDYFLSSTSIQNNQGLGELKKLNEVLKIREKNGKILNDFMQKKGKWYYESEHLSNHSFLKFPIFVKDRELFLKKAEKAKVRLGDWFVSPIHPVLENYNVWSMNPADFPNAESFSGSILNISTDEKRITRVIEFLERNIDDLK